MILCMTLKHYVAKHYVSWKCTKRCDMLIIGIKIVYNEYIYHF